jgi:hypothetical protein
MKVAASQRRVATTNARDYQAVFLQHVHWLLQLGYAKLTPAAFADAEEEVISGELRRHIRNVLYESPTTRWMKHYDVHNEDPEDGAFRPGQTEPRQGKDRPVIDLRFVSSHTCPRKRFCVEAKRLYRSDSVSQYVGPAGLGCFLDGTYAKEDDAAGMLGFVQRDTLHAWAEKIRTKLESAPSAQPLNTGRKWERRSFRHGPPDTFASKHQRQGGAPSVEIYHTLVLTK